MHVEETKIRKRIVRPCYGRNCVKQKKKLVWIFVSNLKMGGQWNDQMGLYACQCWRVCCFFAASSSTGSFMRRGDVKKFAAVWLMSRDGSRTYAGVFDRRASF